MTTSSPWQRVAMPSFPALDQPTEVDVLVVGGGLTGATTAYLLKRAGHRVALIERGRCGQGDSGHTTAHLTLVTDRRIHQLAASLGDDAAQAVWDAGLFAIAQIRRIIEAERIACDFQWVPGHLHASLSRERDESGDLERDAITANRLGFHAEFINFAPVFGCLGMRFADQALFHPMKYLAALLERVDGDGCHVFERTQAAAFERSANDSLIRVTANGHHVECRAVVMASGVPLAGVSDIAGATLLQAKIAPYTTYAIGAELPPDTSAPALYWDTSDPYYFLRIDRTTARDYAVFGGLDHKTGQSSDAASNFDRLADMLHQYLPQARVVDRWTGQVIESHDGLPLIGETAAGQYVATGFSGNGITFGTLAAMMIRDAIGRVANPWKALFDPRRTQLAAAPWRYVRENLDYPYYMIADRLTSGETGQLERLERGQGRLLWHDGRRVAAYRDARGTLSLLSPVCTHLGCLVRWNEVESTWDCPCHGSRFSATGQVIAGPAESPLKRVSLPVLAAGDHAARP